MAVKKDCIVAFPISVNFPFLGQSEIRLQYSVF